MKKLFYLFLVFSIYSCEEKINEFSGFSKRQMEFLLAGDSANVWERITRWENGNQVDFTDCQKQNAMIFIAADNGDVQRLLYTYDKDVCDSLGFCNEYSEYCQSDTAQCNHDPDFCSTLGTDTLYIGTWMVSGVTEDDEITDELLIKLWESTRTTRVIQISSESFEWEYEESTPGNQVKIKEIYQIVR